MILLLCKVPCTGMQFIEIEPHLATLVVAANHSHIPSPPASWTLWISSPVQSANWCRPGRLTSLYASAGEFFGSGPLPFVSMTQAKTLGASEKKGRKLEPAWSRPHASRTFSSWEGNLGPAKLISKGLTLLLLLSTEY